MRGEELVGVEVRGKRSRLEIFVPIRRSSSAEAIYLQVGFSIRQLEGID